MKKLDSPKYLVPDFEKLWSDMDSDSELLEIRSRIPRSTSFRAQDESPLLNKHSPFTPLSDTSQTLMADIESGDASESSENLSSKGRDDTRFFFPFKTLQFSSPEYAFKRSYAHLFDLRGKRGSIIYPAKIKVLSQESDKLIEEISNVCKVPKEHIEIVNLKGMTHFDLKYFGIIIYNPLDLDSCIPVLVISRAANAESKIDFFPSIYEPIHCILFPKGEKVERLKQIFAEKHSLPINSFAFSHDRMKVRDTDNIEDVIKPYDILYFVKQKAITVRLELLQCPRLKHIISIEGITSVDTVNSLKQMFIKTLSDMGATTLNEENLCISKEEEILEDSQILNSIRVYSYPIHSNHSELTLRLHLVQPRYTWYKIDTETAMGLRIIEIVCVNQQSTAAHLRHEVAKICCCTLQAVKLITSGKTIPENKCLEEIPFLQEGCTIKASIASKIKVNVTVIRVGDQSVKREEQLQVEVYRLDTVFKLKQTVIKSLESPVNIHTCVMKKKETLEESKFLKDYGIKDETEVTAYIFEERIQVLLIILKTKKRIQVFIDEPQLTFIKDFLKYIQGSGLVNIHYTQLRLVYKNYCLPMDMRMSDVDVKHGSVLVVTNSETVKPETIMMCPGEQGEVLCMIGKVIGGMIYYASVQSRGDDESHELKASDEPVSLPSGIHHVESSSSSLGLDDLNTFPSLLSLFHLSDSMRKNEYVEREKYIYLRRENETTGSSIHYTLEEKENVHKIVRMGCDSKPDGYVSEQSYLTSNHKCKQRYLKRAKALNSRLKNKIPSSGSPVTDNDKTQIDLNIGQQSQIKVTSAVASKRMTVGNSCMQSRIGTGASTYSASCNTVSQSGIVTGTSTCSASCNTVSQSGIVTGTSTCSASCNTVSQCGIGIGTPTCSASCNTVSQSWIVTGTPTCSASCNTVSQSGIVTGTSTYSASCNTVSQSSIGTVIHPLNLMTTGLLNMENTNGGLLNMQNTNGESCKGGYHETMKIIQKDNETWHYRRREEMMQVTGSAANIGTPVLSNNERTEFGSAPKGHNGGTTGFLHDFTPALLHSIAKDVGVDWKILGRNLSIAEEKISVIDADFCSSVVEKCYQMLHYWCKTLNEQKIGLT